MFLWPVRALAWTHCERASRNCSMIQDTAICGAMHTRRGLLTLALEYQRSRHRGATGSACFFGPEHISSSCTTVGDRTCGTRALITCWSWLLPRADLLHRLNAALGKAAAENISIDEVLPEIKRRR
jgi:hypothetical protein